MKRGTWFGTVKTILLSVLSVAYFSHATMFTGKCSL